MKLFNTSDTALVKQCHEQFNFTLPSVALERRTSFVALYFLFFVFCFFVRLLFLLYVTTVCGE